MTTPAVRRRRVAATALVAIGTVLGACAENSTAPAPAGRPSVDVRVRYCTGLAPVWVAFQDGDGAWTRAEPEANGPNTTFRRLFEANRGAIATLVPLLGGALAQLSVLYGTPAELATAGDTNPFDCAATSSNTLFGTVAGLAANESALVTAGLFSRTTVQMSSDGFTLGGLPSGPLDLLAARTTARDGTAAITRLILRRGLDLPDGATIPALDFASAEAFEPATAILSIIGLGAEGAIGGTRLRTSRGETALSFVTDQPTQSVRPYFAVPEDRLLPGDLQTLLVSTDGPSRRNRSIELYFRSTIDRTAALGAAVAAPIISAVTASPSLRLRARFVPQSDYDRSTSIFYDQAASSTLFQVAMTPAYAAAVGGDYDLVMPDLSAIPGFDPAWTLRPGLSVTWSASRFGGTLGLGRDVVPAEGMLRRSAFLRDTITLR